MQGSRTSTDLVNMKEHKIKLLLLDVDGTLTDGGIYLSANGDEFKKFNSKDGAGIKAAMKAGIQVGIISASLNQEIVLKRVEMLGIQHCYVGQERKDLILEKWMLSLKLEKDEIAFIGDDINDLEIMRISGFTACPADAVDKVKEEVDVILEKKGGEGCVREFIDKFLL